MNEIYKKGSWCIVFLLSIWATMGCATPSFLAFKNRLVSRTDEIIVTFYDSKAMNAKTLAKLAEFSVDNSEEVGEFRGFIRTWSSLSDDCESDGQMSFIDTEKNSQRVGFNLGNRCVAFYPTDAREKNVVQKRLSFQGKRYLERKRQESNADQGAEMASK